MDILDIYAKIINALEDKKIACCIFLDFAKAFNKIIKYYWENLRIMISEALLEIGLHHI